MRRRAVPSLALMLFAPLASCVEQPAATAIVVSVKTDLPLHSELREISCRVFPADADPSFDTPVSEHSTVASALERPFVIVKGSADELLVAIEGFRERGHPPIVTALVRARFEAHKSLALPVFLARACAAKPCSLSGLTCFGQPHGPVAAGECAAIPGPDALRAIRYPGEEAAWAPEQVVSFDAGHPAEQAAGNPEHDEALLDGPDGGVPPRVTLGEPVETPQPWSPVDAATAPCSRAGACAQR